MPTPAEMVLRQLLSRLALDRNATLECRASPMPAPDRSSSLGPREPRRVRGFNRAGPALAVLLAWPAPAQAQLRATASAGIPKLESKQLGLEGSGGLGYAWPVAAVWAESAGRIFDVQQTGREQTETDVRVDAEGNYTHVLSPAFQAHAGAAAGFAQYTTDSTFFGPFSETDEVSQMVRLSAIVGATWQVATGLKAKTVLGAGWQREAYLRTAVDSTGALEDEDARAASLRYSAALDVEWVASADILALALRSDVEGFGITRSRALFRYTPGLELSQQATVASAQRIDAGGRLEGVVLAAEWLTIAPFVYGEMRYVRTAAGGSAVAVIVPSAGAGIRTPLL